MDNNTTKQNLDLLTAGELAGLLRMSKVSIYRLADNGLLPFYRFRGALRFDRKDINNFLRTTYRNAKEI